MPLFFFISGFVLYKEGVDWSFSHVISFLKKKFPVQIITTFLIFLVYIRINHISLIDGLYSDSKVGYWFTYTLFIFFCVYSVSRYLLNKLHVSNIPTDIIILSIGFLFFVLFYVRNVFTSLPIGDDIKNILSMCHWGYYFYFCVGTLFKKYYSKVQDILDNKPVLLISLVTFFVFNLYYDEWIASHINFFYLVTGITGIVIVFSFFRIHQDFFSKETFIGRNLQFIGRRTLDIYLLHYLLLPSNLKAFSSPLLEHPIPAIEFPITITISLVIVGECLLISGILRMSPVLAYMLFGVKLKKN